VSAQDLEGHRPVKSDVHRLVNRSHAAASQLAHDAVAGNPAAGFNAVVARGAFARAGPGRRAQAQEPMNQLEALEGRTHVVLELRTARDEFLDIRRLATFDQQQEGFDRLANAFVNVVGALVALIASA
jgi:hypothetical protein